MTWRKQKKSELIRVALAPDLKGEVAKAVKYYGEAKYARVAMIEKLRRDKDITAKRARELLVSA